MQCTKTLNSFAGPGFILLCLLLPTHARADFYSCKDNAGHLVTSDRPIPECADKPVSVFKDNGMLKTQIATPLNAAQRKAAELQEQERAKEQLNKENLNREQRFLVAHYPNLQAIESARKKELDVIESKIANEKHNIETATTALEQDQTAMPGLAKANPGKVNETKMRIANNTLAIQESNRLLHSYQIEENNVNQQYDEMHKRYVEIVPVDGH